MRANRFLMKDFTMFLCVCVVRFCSLSLAFLKVNLYSNARFDYLYDHSFILYRCL